MGLFPDELAQSPLVVATCSHCDDVVLSLGPGQWAFVEMTDPMAGSDGWRIRRLSSLAEVAAAMAEHGESGDREPDDGQASPVGSEDGGRAGATGAAVSSPRGDRAGRQFPRGRLRSMLTG